MATVFEIEIDRLNKNLEHTNQEIEKLVAQRSQLIGAIAISQKYQEISKKDDTIEITPGELIPMQETTNEQS